MQDLDILETLIKKGDALLSNMETNGRFPNETKTLTRIWQAKEVGADLGKTASTIARAAAQLIESGEMPDFDETQRHPTTKAVLGYTLEQVNVLRRHYNVVPGRTDDLIDEPLILAIQSFKGGVAKTMTSVHFAQYMASKGYKVLLVDMDPQASLTNLFGYNADRDIDYEHTILPYFNGERQDLRYAVRNTYWENLDLIPSNLTTNEVELQLFFDVQAEGQEANKKNVLFNKLRYGLDSVKQDYDLVLLDCPPALGLLTINILGTADAVIIPTPPSLLDFSSTMQYLKMLKETIEKVDDGAKSYKFFKLLRTKVLAHRPVQKDFSDAMDMIFGDYVIPEIFPMIGEIDSAAMEFKTLLEDRRPDKKALKAIEAFSKQIELECLKTWPSKAVEAAYLDKELNQHKDELEVVNG